MLVLTIAVGALAIFSLVALSRLTTDMYAIEFTGVRHVEDARVAAERFRVATLLIASAPNAAEQQAEMTRRREAETSFNQDLDALRRLLHRTENRNLLDQLQRAWAEYRLVEDRVVAAALAGDLATAQALVHAAGRDQRQEVDAVLSRLSANKNQVAAQAANDAEQTYERARNLILGLLGVALLVGAAILFLLRQLIQEIRQSVQRLAVTTSEILASVTQQGASTTEQAAAVSQTTATVDEVRVTAQQATQRAQVVAQQAQRAADVADEGLQTVETTVTGMRDLSSRVESIAEQMLGLSEQTQQIGEVITTVDDLADQSNLLAVNAAIEAARAGEQGRGFSVVAQEVRSLAERSKAATVQVRTILTEIQRAANAAVLATEQGTRGTEEASRLIEQAGHAIGQLAATIRESAEAAQQIVASAGQQGAGMDQIATAMANINQATNETASGARQLQRAAEDMDDLAQRLTDLVGRSGRSGQNGHVRAA